jgi:hypothetical protein
MLLAGIDCDIERARLAIAQLAAGRAAGPRKGLPWSGLLKGSAQQAVLLHPAAAKTVLAAAAEGAKSCGYGRRLPVLHALRKDLDDHIGRGHARSA